MSLPVRFPGIYTLHSSEYARLLEQLKASNIAYFELDGSSICDTKTFYSAAADCLPLDPQLSGTERNWDAFEDSLFGGLADLGCEQVAIIWPDAHKMVNSDLSGLIEVCIVMEDVIRDVRTPSNGIGVAVQLVLILLGRGDGFGPIEESFPDSWCPSE